MYLRLINNKGEFNMELERIPCGIFAKPIYHLA
jgi:hypothetical protein